MTQIPLNSGNSPEDLKPSPQWYDLVRIVWISGGVVAVNNPGPTVQISAGLQGRLLGSLNIPSYPNLLPVIRQQGFQVVGATFIDGPEEAQGLRPPQFRAFSESKGWLISDQHQSWRQIAHASGKSDNMLLMDVASRIASGLAYCEMRLLDLAEAYSKQLRGRNHAAVPKEYQRFKDLNSSAVYKAIHALFWEMAVLRDSLAEFAATFCFKRTGLSSLSGLVRSLRKHSLTDSLAQQIIEAADDANGGWLALFSCYRNLFTHSAPMEQVAGIAFAVQDMHIISPEFSIPQIYYPLPQNVVELSRKRSGGTLFMTLKELQEASSERRPERRSEPDALDYLRNCLDKMAQLALLLAERSPVKAETIQISPTDIIGNIQRR